MVTVFMEDGGYKGEGQRGLFGNEYKEDRYWDN